MIRRPDRGSHIWPRGRQREVCECCRRPGVGCTSEPGALKGRNSRGRATAISLTSVLQWVRERPGAPGHSLPVVAVGSVPHIYRREGHSPGDPNRSCPMTGNHAACLAMSISVRTKLLQGQQSKFTAEESHPELLIVAIVLPLQLHAAEPHAYPRVEFLEHPATC